MGAGVVLDSGLFAVAALAVVVFALTIVVFALTVAVVVLECFIVVLVAGVTVVVKDTFASIGVVVARAGVVLATFAFTPAGVSAAFAADVVDDATRRRRRTAVVAAVAPDGVVFACLPCDRRAAALDAFSADAAFTSLALPSGVAQLR